ncbi:hypothetical protein L2089_00075 [Paenibacillus hunanensis]|uniref:hypothetical protein n=1 Tax=Paenibacillus hunanensis TaxID=539262 RepID=UPI002026A1E6|nr:hypothetical protein [Paenibacillus hunanensis]MCL9659067.1 hypothetical protein [Paenibacillus hunanensis]
MIIFTTRQLKTYNYIIHYFLETEIFNGFEDVGDTIEVILPKYLFREQYIKCIQTFEELLSWTEDDFLHQLSAFHELALYYFIVYLKGLRDDTEDFDNTYFNETCHSLIKKSSAEDFEEYGEVSVEQYADKYYDFSRYFDLLFDDLDFLMIGNLYNDRIFGNSNIEEFLGVNLDFYFEILPLDIQKKHKSKHITLVGEIIEMLDYIIHRLNYGNLYKLFWDGNDPVKEEKIQLILENIMDAYFYNQDVDITREALLGNGKVDFKLYKNKKEDEKVLIEIKRASSSYLKKGYEKQLTDYMLSTSYKNAFYLVACFTDNEFEKVERFIKNHIYTDTVQLYINIYILDLRKRKTASVQK